MYTDGSTELTNAIQEANDAYNSKIAELTTKGLQFENDAIMGAFPEISSAMKESVNKVLSEMYTEEAFNDLANGTIPLTDSVVTAITQAMNTAFSEVAPETRKHIGEFYEQMLPSVEELQKSMQSMEKVPQAYANVFAQSSAIGAVGNNAKALKAFGVTTLSTVLPEDATKVLESSKTYGEYFAKGIDSSENLTGVKTAAERLRTTLTSTLNKPINVAAPINYSFIGPVQSSSSIITKPSINVGSNATGTTYFGGGLTTINEHGYEIMDLPTGTRIYPHSQSEKMMNTSPNVSVSVNVQGNIFGLENAAELIGDMVCGKIVETIKAV